MDQRVSNFLFTLFLLWRIVNLRSFTLVEAVVDGFIEVDWYVGIGGEMVEPNKASFINNYYN